MPRISLNFREYPEGEMLARAQNLRDELTRRRTIRDFSERSIPDGVLEACLEAAVTAPNGANLQPWQFVVVRDPDRKRTIRLAAEEEEQAFYESRAPDEWLEVLSPIGTDAQKPFLETAPALVAIFQKSEVIRPDGTPSKTYYPKESVGLATGFLIAALHHAGLASLTHTPSPMKFLNQILGRPTTEKPFLLLVVGYPADDCRVPDIKRLSPHKVINYQ
jgi:nitroreductase